MMNYLKKITALGLVAIATSAHNVHANDLIKAIQEDNLKRVVWLLENKHNPNEVYTATSKLLNQERIIKQTPLATALQQSQMPNHLNIVATLLEHGARLKIDNSSLDLTALHMLVIYRNMVTLNMLFSYMDPTKIENVSQEKVHAAWQDLNNLFSINPVNNKSLLDISTSELIKELLKTWKQKIDEYFNF